MTERGFRILLVEDNPGDALLLEESLVAAGEPHTLARAERLQDAVEHLRREAADVVMLDLALPDSDGLATLEAAVMAAPHVPIVVMTGLDDESVAIEAVRKGAQSYLVKGQTAPRLLVRTIHYAVERKRLETDLAEAKQAADAANAAKSQFLASMSHELRTPIGAILGMTELALHEPLSPTVRDYLETLRDSAEGLAELLNQLLDLSRIEAGALELECTEFRLRATLDKAIRPLGFRARQKGLELTHQIAPDVPDRLIGDPLRLRQVIINLVANAIKFTHKGEIAVRVEKGGLAIGEWGLETSDQRAAGIYPPSPNPQSPMPLEQPAIELMFSVSDTGVGISPEDRERIFAPYAQADVSTTRKYGGTGLGLAICRRLVELMGGRIEVQSEPGCGSTFCFTVQLRLAAGPGETQDSRAEAEKGRRFDPFSPTAYPLRVLLAEDTPGNRKLVAMLLNKRGHDVQLAEDGRCALELAAREHFDVVLMDVEMPRMDGFQATAAIRQLPDPKKARVPIIAMTAHALKGDAERCLAAGMDAYISKPVAAEEIIEMLERLAGRQATG